MRKIRVHLLIGALLTSILASGRAIQSASAEETLLGYWKLDTGYGTTAYDSSGNNNDGTIYGANWTSGISGSALKFDGVDDYVEVPDLFSTSPSRLTVTAWINSPLDTSPDRTKNREIFHHFRNGEFELSARNGTVAFCVKLTSTHVLGIRASTTPNVWHNVTGVWVKGNFIKLFIDDVLVASETVSDLYLWHWDLPASIGSYGGYARHFNGTIDEVKIDAWAYLPPYDVTIDAYCHTALTDVSVAISMDGSPTGYNTPHTFPDLTDSHTFTVPGTDPHGHPFECWSTGETSTTITVSSSGTYTAYYEEEVVVVPTQGPEIDVLRQEVIRGKDAPYIAMMNEIADVWSSSSALMDVGPSHLRKAENSRMGLNQFDVLKNESFLVVPEHPEPNNCFHLGFIAFNIRPTDVIKSYWRNGSTLWYAYPVDYWPLHDVEFRHALIHCYDSACEPVDPSTTTPVRSLVPPAQRRFYNPYAPEHPYNPGSPFDISNLTADAAAGQKIVNVADGSIFEATPQYVPVWIRDSATNETNAVVAVDGNTLTMENNLTNAYTTANDAFVAVSDHSTCSILREAHYTFADAGTLGTVDDADHWKCPDGSPMPYMQIQTPLYYTSPMSYHHGHEFVADLQKVGLAATPENGNKGFEHLGWDFHSYLEDVYDRAWFDAYMVFDGLGRMPSQLFSLLHSSQDSREHPGRGNAAGVNDTAIDALVETVKYGWDIDIMKAAAKEVQEMLYTPDKAVYPNADNFALSYMCLYSRSHLNAYNPNLRDIVKSPGYGSDNKWTFLTVNWAPGAERLEDAYGDGYPYETVLTYITGESPDSLNPCTATTMYEWNIISQVMDGLTTMNPYNHYDMPWLAEDWTITSVGDGMEIDFTLRDDLKWQDGHDFTAYDIEFCLEFLRDHSVPQYAGMWETLIAVAVTDDLHLTIHSSKAGIDLFYDYSRLAAMLPPQIWDRSWPSDQDVLDYHPEKSDYGTDMATGYVPGPWAANVSTNLFGTGPWIFQFYDCVNEYSDFWANRNYFMSTADIHDLKAEMFWQVGDYYQDGIVNVIDLTFTSFAYGSFIGEPNYDAMANYNSDYVVDIRDLSIVSYHLQWKREYSYP